MSRPTLSPASSPPAVPRTVGTEPPTEPGIWSKLLPDGRVVPWIVLPEPTSETDVGPHPSQSRGCYKCTN